MPGPGGGPPSELNLAQIHATAKVVDAYVNLIPAKHYVPNLPSDDLEITPKGKGKGKKGRGKGKGDGKGGGKGGKAGDQTAAEKAARRQSMFDPKSIPTTVEQLLEVVHKMHRVGPKAQRQPQGETREGDEPAGHRAALQAKLHAKIAAMREDRVQKQREKDKADAQRRRESRIANSQAGAESSAPSAAAPPAAEPSAAAKSSSPAPAKEPKQPAAKDQPPATKEKPPAAKGLAEPLKIVKEDIDFGEVRLDKRKSELKGDVPDTAAPGSKKKRLRNALIEAEAKRRRLEEAEDPAEREELRKQFAIESAQKKLAGEQTVDDPSRIKKAVKDMVKQKERSALRWSQRVEEVMASKQQRAETRKANIDEKIAKKKSKKRPGFEGQVSDFLNADKAALQVDQLEEVLDTLGFQGKYNFVSLPKARGRKANTGFAFVNFIEEEDAQRCLAVARTFRFPGSNRRSRTTVAELQGLEANIELAKGK